DSRYEHLHGAHALVPLLGRQIPIIFDEYVDPAFGTGCLKVTPAHDIHDYNLGLKFQLPVIDVLREDGCMSDAAQLYIGEDRFVVRKKIEQRLGEEGFLVRVEMITNKNGFSQRTQAVVEPRISTQWFLNMEELAKPALEAVLDGTIRIHPGEKFLNTYKHWLENVKDWCISRQLWWGQRIPAFYDANGEVYVAATAEKALELWKQKNPGMDQPETPLHQDEDVLDTWFSSWLWPMEVFEGISQPGNQDISYYYPTSVVVTGQDILFFWVARMIMAGYHWHHQPPFREVYFTGMVRDKQGRKMSKSLGNSPDLLDLIDRFGADAVRFGILISSPAGNDLLFDDSSCEQGRNFCNKLWNALKLLQLWESRSTDSLENREENSFATQWFAQRLDQTAQVLTQQFQEFRLSEALKTIYALIWDDFCSWYLEWIKPGFEQPISRKLLVQTKAFLEQLLELLHPFMPFVTEEIYHLMEPRMEGDDLIIRQIKKYPQPLHLPSGIERESLPGNLLEQGNLAKEIITTIRDQRNKLGIKFKESIALHIHSNQEEIYQKIIPILLKQVNASTISFTRMPIADSFTFVVQKETFYLVASQAVDKSGQQKQLIQELQYLKGFLATVDRKLQNERFIQHAQPEILELERKKKKDAEEKLKILEASLGNL
ncbi:MAG: class I tRNA ligase family protein, partial [Chitinophagaceae bacterium]